MLASLYRCNNMQCVSLQVHDVLRVGLEYAFQNFPCSAEFFFFALMVRSWVFRVFINILNISYYMMYLIGTVSIYTYYTLIYIYYLPLFTYIHQPFAETLPDADARRCALKIFHTGCVWLWCVCVCVCVCVLH